MTQYDFEKKIYGPGEEVNTAKNNKPRSYQILTDKNTIIRRNRCDLIPT